MLMRIGIGTEYLIYAWSACAMLIVMHHFATSTFKRIEALLIISGVCSNTRNVTPEPSTSAKSRELRNKGALSSNREQTGTNFASPRGSLVASASWFSGEGRTRNNRDRWTRIARTTAVTPCLFVARRARTGSSSATGRRACFLPLRQSANAHLSASSESTCIIGTS
jgi:hypothetical protein